MKDLPHLQEDSEVVRRIRHRTAVSIDLVDMDDSRARLCPPGNYLLRVAGARDQVGWLLWSRSSAWDNSILERTRVDFCPSPDVIFRYIGSGSRIMEIV